MFSFKILGVRCHTKMVMGVGCCCPTLRSELQKLSGTGRPVLLLASQNYIAFPFLIWYPGRERLCRLAREPLWPVKKSGKTRVLPVLPWLCSSGKNPKNEDQELLNRGLMTTTTCERHLVWGLCRCCVCECVLSCLSG